MNLEYPLDSRFYAYRHIQIIKCKQAKIIIIGRNDNQDQYGGMVFNKIKSADQNLSLIETFIQIQSKSTYQQIKYQIQKVIGNYHTKESINGFGIIGFHKFLQGYYMTYISEVDTCAKIGKHKIYTIKNTSILPLFEYQSERKIRKNQQKYLQILQQFKLQNFYFSCTYDLSNSLAKNMIRNSKKIFDFKQKQKQSSFKRQQEQYETEQKRQKILEYSQIFAFNYELIEQFNNSIRNKKFILPIIHGYCKHINVNLKSTTFNIIVIARRSRHHAGTRYIKRGINPDGFVANFVQIQQIAVNYSSSQNTRPVCSSFIQVRGSVPTYWMQRPSIHIPKPAIQIKLDDYMFLSTRKHFSDLMSRYGNRIYAINLMKTKQKVPRQSLLSKQYQTAISFINKQDLREQNQIHYIQIDMKYHLRLDKKLFVNKMRTIAYFSIQNTGLFVCMNPSTSSHEQFIQIQNGIIRANCVDCLDRTNSFQQLVGQTALAIQLNRLMNLDLPQKILDQYSKLYEQMGDLISIQYGSSLAHKQKIQKSTQSRFQFLIAITRHVNNNWNDYDRQEQMDVFLGYKPDPDGPQIWQIKPTIQHYPSKALQRLQRTDWCQQSTDKFMKSHCISDYRSINNKQDYQRILPHMQRFVKQDLVSKFNVQIVNSLVNQRQKIDLLQFFLMPKQNYTSNFWLSSSKNTKNIQTLKQQLQFCYNNFDSTKQIEDAKPILNSQKLIKSDLPHQIRKNFGMGRHMKQSSSFFLIQDKGINNILKNNDKNEEVDYFDEVENKIIQRYMLGELIEDFQIQDEIQKYIAFLNGDIQIDWPSQYDIQKQLKLLQSNMNSKNYINYSQFSVLPTCLQQQTKKRKTMVQSTSQKVFKNIESRNQKMKQNKILILQRIMKKNFSHGNVQRIQEI